MKISMVGQPAADSGNLHGFLTSGCADTRYAELRFATAWAKQSGLIRVKDAFASFRARGGRITALVGISEGGATRQGLHLTVSACDLPYVFHDAGRTFHPKVYLFSGKDDWSLFIGSNNVTAGGTFWNYEAALEVSGSRHDPDGAPLLRQVEDWLDGLIADTGVCKTLNAELIKDLIETPAYRIGDEIRMTSKKAEGPGDHTSGEEPLFGRSTRPRHPDPARPGSTGGGGEPAPEPVVWEDSPLEKSEILTHSWFKKLSPSDAQRPGGAKSKVTGNLRLSQYRHRINKVTYFRHRLFGTASWEAEEKPGGIQETATMEFEVVMGTVSHGTHRLTVDHAVHRAAGQGNVTTVLHWGTTLSGYLKTAADHTHDYVTIECFADGSRRLTISADPIGEAQAGVTGVPL
jgi:hypothetical protein